MVGRGERWDSFQHFTTTHTQLLLYGLRYSVALSVQNVSSVPFTQGGLESWENMHKPNQVPLATRQDLKGSSIV